MILRVEFKDNDFCCSVLDACRALLEEVTLGYTGETAVKEFQDFLERVSLENVRKSIVVSANAFHQAWSVIRKVNLVKPSDYGIFYTDILKDNMLVYLDENITVSFERSFPKVFENGEVAYINPHLGLVYLQ